MSLKVSYYETKVSQCLNADIDICLPHLKCQHISEASLIFEFCDIHYKYLYLTSWHISLSFIWPTIIYIDIILFWLQLSTVLATLIHFLSIITPAVIVFLVNGCRTILTKFTRFVIIVLSNVKHMNTFVQSFTDTCIQMVISRKCCK